MLGWTFDIRVVDNGGRRIASVEFAQSGSDALDLLF